MNQLHPTLDPCALLWDLDGTLVDSMAFHYRAWREVLTAEGYDLTWEAFARTFGQRNDTALRDMLGRDLAANEVDRISALKEEGFRSLVRSEGLQLLPGTSAWLTASRQAGRRQALVTSAPRPNVETMLDVLQISAFFDVVVTGDDVALGKPHPEPYLLAARTLGVAPMRCVVVEDSPSGIEAARRAGMRSIGVGHAHASLPATVVVASLADLRPDVLQALLSAA